MKLSEQWILSQAPNATAAQNGKKLSQKGSFSKLGKTEDNTLYWADCAGSGKTPYHTSIDFVKEDTPTCRCSCPSRQFPCKHALGLMYEILAEKPFAVMEVPEDLAQKRAKQAAKRAKQEQVAKGDAPAKPKRTNSTAKVKKIKKQLEGLEKAQQMMTDLLTHGLGTLAGTSAKSFQSIAKDLASYYVTGAQIAFLRLAKEVETIQKNPENADYQEAVRILIWLNAMIQKSRTYLQEKLEKKEYDVEDTMLYEALGGIWKLEDLERIGSMKENVLLVQLSFDVLLDEAKKEYRERAYWMEVESGAIHQSLNYRPLKALQYVKEDDSCFEAVRVPQLCYYPGSGNQRIRWESSHMEPVTTQILKTMFSHAQGNYAQAVKQAKNEFKNTLSEKYIATALSFDQIGRIGNEMVLQNEAGEHIVLRNRKTDGEDHATVEKLVWLPNDMWKHHQVLFGLLFYDAADARICFQPYSILTKEQIIRLQY